MVAEHITLPNIRRQFIPDPGYVIVDMDLAGADAQVVAWEADDLTMKNAFRAGEKIHVVNARDLFDDCANMTTEEIKESKYYKYAKIACHATNYVGSAGTIALILKWPISAVEEFQERYFDKRPGIKEWHKRTMRFLEGEQCWNCHKYPDPAPTCYYCHQPLGMHIKNAFNYRIRYFEATPDRLMSQAVAWSPQSTVGIITRKALIILDEEFPWAEYLIQVHDSLVFQVPKNRVDDLELISTRLNNIEVPYPDPLKIPWGVGYSARSWGDIKG